MLALCTVFIVTCTDGLGEHGDIDEFGTRNAYLNGCSISTFVDQLFLEVERRGGRLSLVGFGDARAGCPPKHAPWLPSARGDQQVLGLVGAAPGPGREEPQESRSSSAIRSGSAALYLYTAIVGP
jgi:hypothetical protein